MGIYEERLELLENALTRAAQTQEQGQAKLEQAFKRQEELISAAGKAVAQAMTASAGQAAQAHLEALMGAVDEVAIASRGAVAEAAKAIQGIRASFQAEVVASQGILKGVNGEAERASGLLKQMGDQGAYGADALAKINAELGALPKSVADHKVQLNAAIDKAQEDARKELGKLKDRVREVLPGYLIWLRESLSFGVILAAVIATACTTYVLTSAHAETKLVEQMVPVGRFYTVYKADKGKGETKARLVGSDLNTPIREIGEGLYEAMVPDGKGGWSTSKNPEQSWSNPETARVYKDQTREQWFK